MDWSPSKQAPKRLPRICMKMRKSHEPCDYYVCDDVHLEEACGNWEDYDKTCYDGDERMGDLYHRLIKHIKANSRLSKKEYVTHAKTIRLRNKANRAIASHHDSHHLAYPEKDRRAEQRDSIAVSTLACLIDISNSKRIQAQCAIISAGSTVQ